MKAALSHTDNCDQGEIAMCGIAAVYGHPRAAIHALSMLGELRHRGQDERGIAVYDGRKTYILPERPGRVPLDHPENHRKLQGHIALVHARYRTSGSRGTMNEQPAFADGIEFRVTLVQNGDTPLLSELRRGYTELHSDTEAEVIARILVDDIEDGMTPEESLFHLPERYDGAYALIVLVGDTLYLARDPLGFRPLWIGEGERAPGKKYFVAASEDEAIRAIGAHPIREVAPGEVVVVTPAGFNGHTKLPQGSAPASCAHCLFEQVYFGGVRSKLFGVKTELFRVAVGRLLGSRLREQGVQVDAVAPVPDSSNPFSEGLAEGLGAPLTFGVFRTHPVRTFINDEESRPRTVREKYKPSWRLAGKRLLLGDDSVVRGNTMRQLVKLLRTEGSLRELHLAVGSPPVVMPCCYGIAMKGASEFHARRYWVDGAVDEAALARGFALDSVHYARMEELNAVLRDLGAKPENFCRACWSGNYPTPGGVKFAKGMQLS